MVRIARKYLESEYYHIMVQGIERGYIFEDVKMKEKYKKLVFEKINENQIILIAYCIMDNHTHLLLKAKKSEDISKLMSQVNTSFGKYFNTENNRVGYVYRDRYRAEPIFNERYLKNCIKYIHNNPVAAGMVKKCEDYGYSSFNDYRQNKMDLKILKELYGEKDSYISDISGECEDYKFIDVDNEFGMETVEKFEIVIKEYENEDFTDKKIVYKVAKEIKKRSMASNKKIYEFMGVKKTTFYRIMKKEKMRLFMGVSKFQK